MNRTTQPDKQWRPADWPPLSEGLTFDDDRPQSDYWEQEHGKDGVD